MDLEKIVNISSDDFNSNIYAHTHTDNHKTFFVKIYICQDQFFINITNDDILNKY